MKANHLSVLLMALVMSTPAAFCSASKTTTEDPATSPVVENKLTAEEVNAMTKRVEEIRDMDKTDMTVTEKRELKKELKETKENIRKDGGYIYIGTGTVILIIILLLLL